jgi:UDP-glucose 4-epimerase
MVWHQPIPIRSTTSARRAGEQVIVLDNLSTGFRWAVRDGVPIIVGDSGDEVLVSRLIRENDITAIIHFAAATVTCISGEGKDPMDFWAGRPWWGNYPLSTELTRQS